ncbi:MAG TPA: hypothetical protein VGP33_08510 [Chloroflexota bacterium]|jgi:hypothetical protein|nr:hypothetical protein [Chloroflexota bacterium]
MSTYQLTAGTSVVRLADGAIIPDAPGNVDWAVYQAWVASGNTPTAAPAIVRSTTITTFDYFGRFTPTETNAIHGMALTNPPNATSLALFNYLMLAAANGSVTLDSTTVVTGHALLVQLGLLTQTRSTAILTP